MRTSTLRAVLLGSCAVAIAAALVLAGCSSSTTPATAPSTSGPSTSAAVSTAPIDLSGTPTNAPVNMGQATKSGDWGLTVKSLTFAGDAGGAKAGPGKELAVVTVDLSNNAIKDAGIGQTDFKFAGADGVNYQAVPTSGSDFIFNTPQPIKAGETRTIKIAFEVTAGVRQFRLTFSPFSPSGSASAPAVVNVQ